MSQIEILLNSSVLFQKQNNKFILYNKKTETVLELNETALVIMEKIKKPIMFFDLLSDLSKDYNIPIEEIKNDVEEFISIAQQKGFVTLREV